MLAYFTSALYFPSFWMSLVWPPQTQGSRSYITRPSCSVPPRPALPRGLVSRERWEDNTYMDLTRTGYEVAVQLYCLSSCWIHLWTLLLEFAFLRRSDVLEGVGYLLCRLARYSVFTELKISFMVPTNVSNFVLNTSAPPSDATSNTTRAYLRATLIAPHLHNSSTPPWRFRHTITPKLQAQVPGSVSVPGHSFSHSSPIPIFRVFQRPWSYAS